MKTCPHCDTEKPLSAFYRGARYRDGYRPQCRACHNARRRRTHVHTPERALSLLRDHRRRTYGLSIEDVKALLTSQGGVCAICPTSITERTAHVDHSHAAGRVRGLLCRSCNLALGNFEDDPKRMTRAIAYLKEHE